MLSERRSFSFCVYCGRPCPHPLACGYHRDLLRLDPSYSFIVEPLPRETRPRRWGGVLEHPAYSLAWREYALPRPRSRGGWTTALEDDGAVIELSQSAYGHEARKRTWLYAVGCELPALHDADPRGVRQVSAFQLAESGRTYMGGTLDHGRSSYTPPAFRDVLLAMARSAARQPVAA